MHAMALLLMLWSPPPRPVALAPDIVSAASVLHGWDARRQHAWAASSPRALRDLYVAGSPTGAADLALLRRYTAHHLVVRRITTQVFALAVVHREPTRLRLRVLDRVAGGEVDDGRSSRPLPTTTPSARVVDLRLIEQRWRVVSVRPVSDSGRDPR